MSIESQRGASREAGMAATGLETAGGAMMATGVGVIPGLITELAGLGVQAWSSYEGAEAQKNATNDANRITREQADAANAYTKQQTQKEWDWKENDRDYQRRLQAYQAVTGNIATQSGLQNHLMGMWVRR